MEEAEPFIEKPSTLPTSDRLGRKQSLLPWALTCLLATYIFVSHGASALYARNIEGCKATSDFVPARAAISATVTRFTSSLDFADKEHIYRIFDPTAPVYVGNASSEIDANWDNIILPADIPVTDEEASTLDFDVELYRDPESGYHRIELEVFHSLHCLNMLRKGLYAEHYPETKTHNAKLHLDHCIEGLRELIMCDGNMTPIPITWSSTGQRMNPDYAQKRTCRNFDALKEWTKKREHSPL